MSSIRISSWSGSESELAQVAELYASAFAEQPYGEDPATNRASFPARVHRNATERPEFRLLMARVDARLAGFVLGTGVGAGDWWRDRLSTALPLDVQARWLRDECFSVAELAVDPAHRRSGVAQELMNAVTEDLPYATAILSCYADATAARALYTALGWTTIATDLRIGDSPSLWLFGRRLR